jgi:large subunit ribosomal protein L35Ae
MEGIIVSFRRGRHTQYTSQMIVESDSKNSKDLIGKKVIWTSPGKDKKQISGEIKALHGNKGRLRVHFERGMPGQSLGTKVKIE